MVVLEVLQVLAELQYYKYNSFRVDSFVTNNVKARDPVGSKNRGPIRYENKVFPCYLENMP